LIVEDPKEQRIEIDAHTNINIFNREKTPTGHQLVHYLYYGSLWEGYIIDLSGSLINSFICEDKMAGEYNIQWDGKDKTGREVNSGIFLIRLQAGRHTITRSVDLL